MQPKAPLPGGDATLKSRNAEQVKRISGQILAAADIDQILLDLRHEILGCFDAEDLTLFVVDSEKKKSSQDSSSRHRSGSAYADH